MRRAALSLAALLLLASCSTTRLLPEGEYLLSSSRVEIRGKDRPRVSELTQYVRQQPNASLFGWNPFISVYNWSDGSGKGINALWEKIGTAPVVLDQGQLTSSCEAMEAHLSYLGYYDAKVSPAVSYKGRKASVRYVVEPGRRHRIDSLVFEVPDGQFGDEFRSDSASVTIRKGGWLSEKSLEAETVRGASYFRNLGYYSFNKNNYFFEADTIGGQTVLYYRIRGYTRNESPQSDAPIEKYRIGDVSISYPSGIRFRKSMLESFNTIHPGDWYSENLVNATYNRFSALGVFNSVNVELSPADSARVDCDIRLSGSGVFGFKANFEASSNSSGLLGVSPQLTFFHKNLFRGGERLNLDLSGSWQFNPATKVRATELGVSASLGFPNAGHYRSDRADDVSGSIPRTEIKASYNYQNRPEYRRGIAGFSYGFSGQKGSRLFYQFYPLQLNLVNLYDISDDFQTTLSSNPYLWDSFEDQIDAGVGGMLYYTTNSDIVPKTPYHYARISVDVAGNLISLFNRYMSVGDTGKHCLLGLPYNQYVKAALTLGRTFRFGSNDSQALALRFDSGIGKAYGNSLALPFEKQFYCGGASSMRGWQVRSLGPGFSEMNSSFIIPSQTGDIKLEADMEYRFAMFWKLEGALFAEAGNVWQLDDMEEFRLESVAADWGLGVRLNLDFILLRLDMGFRIHDPSRAAGRRWVGPSGWFKHNGYAVHFGVGYPF